MAVVSESGPTGAHALVQNLLAGLSVSFAALSLGAAFGVMSGRGAMAGMIAASVIPLVTSVLGGTRIQASGPTAPMTAVTAVIVATAYEHFPGERALAEQYITLVLLLASGMIVLAGALRLGRFIALVPQVVVLGFMNGIALLIWMDQAARLGGFLERQQIGGSPFVNLLVTAGTLGCILGLPYLLRASGLPHHLRRLVPSMFVAILLMTLITDLLTLEIEHVRIDGGGLTAGEFLDLLLAYLPRGDLLLDGGLLWLALPLAAQLCMLAYLDSLLTSLVVDRLTGERTAHDRELLAQGAANAVVALLQGIPGAQATIRSVLLVNEGATSRIAGVFVGTFALLGVLVFSQWITHITAAVFAGVLLKAGLDVFDQDFPRAYLRGRWYRNGARNLQLLVIVYTTVVTVFWNLNFAVITGTLVYYLLRRLTGLPDTEEDLTDIPHADLLGYTAIRK